MYSIGCNMKIMGVDQSMQSSGKVIMDLDDKDMSIKRIDFYGYHKTKKRCIETDNIHVKCFGTSFPKLNIIQRRMMAIDYLLEGTEDVKYMALEDYAYGELKRKKDSNTNSILQLAEFAGTLKTEVYRRGIGVIAYPITQNKYFACGDGKGGKTNMVCAMQEVYPELFPSEFAGQYESPVNDMVDAFWLCEVLRNHIMYDRGFKLDDVTRGLLESKSDSSSKSLVETPLLIKDV